MSVELIMGFSAAKAVQESQMSPCIHLTIDFNPMPQINGKWQAVIEIIPTQPE